MSTSAGNPQGVVRIVDEPDVIRKKFKTAVTDSEREIRHDPTSKPASRTSSRSCPSRRESRFPRSSLATTAPATASSRRTWARRSSRSSAVKERYAALRAASPGSGALLADGAERAREASRPTLETMYERMGFVRPA